MRFGPSYRRSGRVVCGEPARTAASSMASTGDRAPPAGSCSSRKKKSLSAHLNARRGLQGGGASAASDEVMGDGMNAEQVDEAWRALLEECLPDPEKRMGLMKAYEQESDPRTRYSMLVEFSSYLRQVPVLSGGGDRTAVPLSAVLGVGSSSRSGRAHVCVCVCVCLNTAAAAAERGTRQCTGQRPGCRRRP